MPQIFHRSFNTLSKVSICGGLFILAFLGWALYVVGWSPYVTQAHIARVQPVPFSHEHHVGQLGIDCRYCHTSVEESAFAGMPPTKTCMNCHQQIWVGSRHAGAGARELPDRQVDRVAADPQPARVRLLRPQHPRQQGRRLRRVPRPRRPDAVHLTRRSRCSWSGASIATATRASSPAA